MADTPGEVYVPGFGVFRSNRETEIQNTLNMWSKATNHYGALYKENPDFARFLAGYFYDTLIDESPIDRGFVARQGSLYGVSNSLLQGLWSQGGGGSGINRANELRSLQTTILNRSTNLGLELSPEEINYMAKVAQDQSYSSEQVDNMLVSVVNWDKLQSGTLTASRDQIKGLAANYLVGMSDQTVQQWSEKVAKNQATAASIESYLRSQAKIMNPWMAEYIDQGLTPGELLQSSRDLIAQNLEIDANAVDFMDDRFMSLATMTDDKGNTKLATQQQLMKNIRKDAAWSSTQQAKNVTTGLAQLVAEIFGRGSF